MDLYFDGISSTTLRWSTLQENSYIGFQPYIAAKTEEEYKFNLMYHLKNEARLIDSNVISFNLRKELGHSSYVKFGGYDVIAFEKGTTDSMSLIKTRSNSNWYLPLTNLAYKSDGVGGVGSLINIEDDTF